MIEFLVVCDEHFMVGLVVFVAEELKWSGDVWQDGEVVVVEVEGAVKDVGRDGFVGGRHVADLAQL